jgi:hypothetical protein
MDKVKNHDILNLLVSEGIKNSLSNKKLTEECFTLYLPAFVKNIDGPFVDNGANEA